MVDESRVRRQMPVESRRLMSLARRTVANVRDSEFDVIRSKNNRMDQHREKRQFALRNSDQHRIRLVNENAERQNMARRSSRIAARVSRDAREERHRVRSIYLKSYFYVCI